jgi:hypothetical protein
MMIGCTYGRYMAVSTPNDLAGPKCLKFNFRHNMTSAPETPSIQRGGPLSGDARGSRPTDRVKVQLRLSGIGARRCTVASLMFPDNTVLINFAIINRMGLLEKLANGNAQWCATVAGECAESAGYPGLAALSAAEEIFGEPLYPTPAEHQDVQVLRNQFLRERWPRLSIPVVGVRGEPHLCHPSPYPIGRRLDEHARHACNVGGSTKSSHGQQRKVSLSLTPHRSPITHPPPRPAPGGRLWPRGPARCR